MLDESRTTSGTTFNLDLQPWCCEGYLGRTTTCQVNSVAPIVANLTTNPLAVTYVPDAPSTLISQFIMGGTACSILRLPVPTPSVGRDLTHHSPTSRFRMLQISAMAVTGPRTLQRQVVIMLTERWWIPSRLSRQHSEPKCKYVCSERSVCPKRPFCRKRTRQEPQCSCEWPSWRSRIFASSRVPSPQPRRKFKPP